MEKWWLLSQEEISHDHKARVARQQAYFIFLYGSVESRIVTNDIRELCYSSGNIELIELYNLIRNIAGRTRLTELAMINAEADAIVTEEDIIEEEAEED